MKKITLPLVFLFLTLCLNAQNRNAISMAVVYGNKVLDENGTYKGLNISYQFNTANNMADWTKQLNVKNINIEAGINDMSNITGGCNLTAYNAPIKNKSYLGSNITLTGGLDIGLIDLNRFKLMFSPGIGVAYATKTYFNTRGVNQMLGCHLNAMGTASIKLLIPVTNDVSVNMGAGISHISNSNTTCPNVGLNYVNSFIGITNYLGYATKTAPQFNVLTNTLSVEVIAGYTRQATTGFYQLKNVNLQLDHSYRKPTKPIAKAAVSIDYNQKINNIIGLKTGADFVYSAKTSPLGNTTNDTTRFIETFQGKYTAIYHNLNVGISAGFDLYLGRLVLSANEGYFLGGYESYSYHSGADKFNYGNELYTTLSARYFVTPNLALEAKSFLSNFGGVGVDLRF